MLRPKLLLRLTEILQNPAVLKKHDVFYSSAIPEVTWYEPLYNKYKCFKSKYFLVYYPFKQENSAHIVAISMFQRQIFCGLKLFQASSQADLFDQ